jgi:outer membrane protein assembly factor BamB
MKSRIILCLLPLVLTGCDKLEEWGIAKSDKKVMTGGGERETVLLNDVTTAPTASKVAGAVVIPAAENVKDWPQAGQNSTHAIPHVHAAHHVKPLWEISLGAQSSSNDRLLCEPIIADGHLIIYTPDSVVTAYDAHSGAHKWSSRIKPEDDQGANLGGGVAYSNGKIFVTTPYAELFAIDAKGGKQLWSAKTNSPLRGAPSVTDGRVFVVSLSNELHAYDEQTGKQLWSHAGAMESAGMLGGSTPSIHQSVVIAPYSSGEVFALQAENGYPLWTENLSSAHRTDSIAGMPHIRAKPVIKEGVAYVVSQAGRSAAFDLRSGDIRWKHEFGGSQTPLVAGDSIFIMTNDNQLICLEKSKGLIRWIKPLQTWQDESKNKGRIVWNGPILAGSHLFVTGSHGTLLALKATDGSKAYEHQVSGNVVIPPIAANGIVYVVTESGSLIAFK